MTNFRTRPAKSDDEVALNNLYNDFKGRTQAGTPRTLQYMRWLRGEAPAGPADCWVIETEESSGAWRMIGHHSLAPFRFTLGDLDLVCAKTLETILLPEFRSKFCYLSFEQECLEQVSSRYDATYCHGGDSSRYRKLLGYQQDSTWVSLEYGSRRFDLITRLYARWANRHPHAPWRQIARGWAAGAVFSGRKPAFELIEYSADEAKRAPFFADFWSEARAAAGMAPRRDVADLTWRFWTRPESSFATLVHTWAGGARGYCIVETSSPFVYCLSDIAITPARTDLLEEFLDALFAWCARRGALTLSFMTTTNGHSPELMEIFYRRMRVHPLQRYRPTRTLQRRVSRMGKEKIRTQPRWNVTEFLLPG